MAINPIVGARPAPAVDAGKEKFGKVLSEVGPKPVAPPAQQQPPTHASAVQKAAPGKSQVGAPQAVKVIDQVAGAPKRRDRVRAVAPSGKTFTPAELLAMQAHVYRASQELDLAGKVVEKATGGVKQVLQTQI
jgi:hypothetical protein